MHQTSHQKWQPFRSQTPLALQPCPIQYRRCNVTIVSRAAQEHSQGIVASAALESLDEVDESAATQERTDHRPKQITLADPQYRFIQRWWHPTRNLPNTPADFRHRCSQRIWLQCEGCPRCGEVHVWNPRVSDLTSARGKKVCPQCDSRAGKFCSCRAVSRDLLLKREWHEDNPKTASEVSLGHQQKVKWKCSQCEHVWMSRPAFRSNDGTGCPECGKARRVRHGSIATVRPDLMKEWDYTKNGANTPHTITCGSCRSIWWKCQNCEHEWAAVVKARALNGAQCPVCSKGTRFSVRQFAKNSPTFN